MKYTVRYERNPDGWWTAQAIEEPAAITQAKSLKQARKRIREALEAVVGTRARKAELVDDIALPAKMRKVVARAVMQRQKLEQVRDEANESTAVAASKLTRELGLTVRDAGEILGLSHQRVQQLLD